MENLCRLCGNKYEIMFYVFDDFHQDRHVHSKIMNVLRINIDPNDALPKKICKDCHQRLDDASNFIDYCQNTQHRLQELCDADPNLPSVKQTEYIDYSILSSMQIANDNNPLPIDANPAMDSHIAQENSQSRVNPSTIAMGNTFQINEKSQLNNEDQNDHETPTTNVDIMDMENEIKENNSSGDTITSSHPKEPYLLEKLRENLRRPLLPGPKIVKHIRTAKILKKEKSVTKKKRKVRVLAPNHGDSEFLSGMKSTLKKREWTCDTCQMIFTQQSLFTEHLNVHSGKRPHVCKLCSHSFRKRQDLNQHIRTIHSQKKFKCETCGFVAKYKGKLTEHVRNVHEKPFECSQCTYRSGEKSKINQHISNRHNGDLSYMCEICGLGFRTRPSLQVHRMSIHFPEPKICRKCGTVCPSLAKYSAHIFLCGKEKKLYTCEHCQKTYVSKQLLADHMNKHLNIKPYKCDICDKDFYQKNRLNTHKFVHRGAIYQCGVCSQAFNRKDNMKNHLKKHLHKPIKCDNATITAV